MRCQLRQRDADDQRVAEVQARDGCDRVVEAAQQVGAQVEPGVGGDRVREAEAGEARRCGGVQDVPGERQRGADDQRGAQERKRVRAAAMHPDECSRRAREMQQDVEESEQRGHAGERRDEVLHVALDEDIEVALQRDDVGGVRASRHPVQAPEAADDLVRAVQGGERCELDPAGVGPVGESADAVEGHSCRLPGRRGPNHAASQCLGVRKAVPENGSPGDVCLRLIAGCHDAFSITSVLSERYRE